MKDHMTRQQFLRVLLASIATGAGVNLLASCSSKEETPKAESETSATASKPVAAAPCSDVSSLSQAELTMRNDTLKYVAMTEDPSKRCDNCKFWQPAETDAEMCGGCTLIKGPISPKGYCSSWFTQDTEAG